MKIFISYARRDAADLAWALERDLEHLGFQVWLDKSRLLGGDVWDREIEKAIDNADVTLALLSAASSESDICRAEQRRSRRSGNLIIPIRVQRNCNIPIHLETRQLIDFFDPASYSSSLELLSASIRQRRKDSSPSRIICSHNNTPPLPVVFVSRPELLDDVRNLLFADVPNRSLVLTALHGMGGIGKTVLAQALCLDQTVQDAFPDGIFWFTLGKEYRLTFEQSLASVPGMKEMVGGCKGEEACLNEYRNALRNRTALIVLDDVWRPDHITPFRIDSPRSRLLITTRDVDLADAFRARSFTATAFASGEARVLLAQSAGLAESAQLPPEADSILDECHNSPLAISLIGAELRNKSAAQWNNVLEKLREPEAFSRQQVPVARDRKVFQAIHVSFEALRQEDSAAAERYVALGICPEDSVITAELQQLLWNLDAGQALEASDKLVRLGLAQRYGQPQDIRLHDFQTDYVRSRFGDQNTLGLIREAVRLSAHVTDKYPLQSASQWIGRLINRKEMPGIGGFIQHLVETAPVPWLQPLRPALEPPGTTLYLTLTGHSSGVNEVAITPDGRFAASASYDRTVGVWDLEFGRLRHTLRGHKENVTTVAISADGRRALSAAWDGEARFWDPTAGTEILRFTLRKHPVTGVSMSADGKSAVLMFYDGSIVIVDLRTGAEIRFFTGGNGQYGDVVMAADGGLVAAHCWEALVVWNVENGREVWRMAMFARHLSMSGDGQRIVCSRSVWDVNSGRNIHTLGSGYDSINATALSADGAWAVTAGGSLRVWRVEDGREVCTLTEDALGIETVGIAANGKTVISAHGDKLHLWRVDPTLSLPKSSNYGDHFEQIDVAANGGRIVTAAGNGRIEVRNGDSYNVVTSLAHGSEISGVCVSADGRWAVSSGSVLKLWDLDRGVEVRNFGDHACKIRRIALSGDGHMVIAPSEERGALAAWNTETGRLLFILGDPTEEIGYIGMSKDGTRAVSAPWFKSLIKVWDLARRREIGQLKFHRDDVAELAISDDGRHLLSASRDGAIIHWDLDRQSRLRTLREGRPCASLALSRNGRRASIGFNDGGIQVWDLERGAVISEFTCDDAVLSSAFVADDRVLAGDLSGFLHVLHLRHQHGTRNRLTWRPLRG